MYWLVKDAMAEVFGQGNGDLTTLVDKVEGIATDDENLMLLAAAGRVEEMKAYLVSGKGPVNEQDTNGYTALMAAASYGQLEALRYLLSHDNVDLQMVDVEGDSALHYCMDVECLKALVEAGGDVNLKNTDGKTPKEHFMESIEDLQEDLEDDEGSEDAKLAMQEREKLTAMVEYLDEL